jgi:hypothetical protein
MYPAIFDWSQITRQALYNALLEHTSILGQTQIPIRDFQKSLRKFFNQYPIRTKNTRSKLVTSNQVYVGGDYYSDDDYDRLIPIEIVFTFCPKETYLNIDKDDWDDLCLLVADVTLHEIIHLKQYRSRNFKTKIGYASQAKDPNQRGQQEYLGDTDEIDAYAFNLACELWDRFGSDFKQSKHWLNSDLWQVEPKSQFYQYMKTFDGDHNHLIIVKLKRKTLNYLPNIDIDKPFRTRRYLTS